MSEDRELELNARALDPAASVVIEACAGSGKTWMLVSRIVRLLLADTAPSQILAITFTRKAAQEMATRLRAWLYELATASDEDARKFLRERAVPEQDVEALLPKARQLYERFLTAQPPITIATFHSWFLQLLRRAPLDAGALGDVNLVEQTSALVEEAWESFASRVQRDRESPVARGLDRLFGESGLENTRRLLTRFLHRRADWQAYTRGQKDPVGYALERIREEMAVAPDADVIGPLLADAEFQKETAEYAALLARNTPTDQKLALRVTAVDADTARRFDSICSGVLTDKGEPRSRKAGKEQAKRLGAAGEARLLELHAVLGARLLEARADLADQASYRFNEAALHCGVALLDAYQRVKGDRQVIDYADIECHAWELVSVSDHAVYMHYKLDSRYRHILLDEFQDTNPLQWLTLKSWLEAAAAADMRPTVFMVGDPKQSIYRFRRAETRLFAQAARYLQEEFGARTLPQDESRRCPPPVIEAVNRVFSIEDAFKGFEKHAAHYRDKPGRVEVLPLVQAVAGPEAQGVEPGLRNPLEQPLADDDDRPREREAEMLVEKIRAIHGKWQVATDLKGEQTHPADYRDIMILVRRRTHLAIYERALRHAGIPFVTSRQGGLLETLEAQDVVALLEFLVSPFADLKLAHALRSPVFACADEDLIAIAAAGGREKEGTWWERLQHLADCSPALERARGLLAQWLARADALPVHDQLDRIYFEGDVMRRYAAAVPAAMRGAVLANLQAFMQRALDVDSGRYPSLPRFLHELADLRAAPPEEAPDEGIVGDAGNAVRIYTVHGAKGLQAPIVWILDAAAGQDAGRGYEAQVDWPPEAETPRAFSLWPKKDGQSKAQRHIADEEVKLAERENLNLLYVAMTRAQQALIVSGSVGRRGAGESWHSRIHKALGGEAGAAVSMGDDLTVAKINKSNQILKKESAIQPRIDARLAQPLPTGTREPAVTGRGLAYGLHFHALMDRLTGDALTDRAALQRLLGLAEREFAPMWEQAQRVLASPALKRFFDRKQFRRAANEVAYVAADGEVRRIDRLVEFEKEVFVLDYKTGSAPADAGLAAQYEAQIAEYRAAVKAIYSGKTVRALLVFSDGTTTAG
jgi:ATP-dependent helicase/nuclease subunit A